MTAPEKHKTKKFKNCFNYYVELKQIVEQINVLQKILSAIIPKKSVMFQRFVFAKKNRAIDISNEECYEDDSDTHCISLAATTNIYR